MIINRNCNTAVDNDKQENDAGQHNLGDDDENVSESLITLFSPLILVSHWQMFNQNVEEEDSEGQDKAKNEPDINHLDVGGGGQLVGDCHVQRVHHQHGGDGHRDVGLEVLLAEVEC